MPGKSNKFASSTTQSAFLRPSVDVATLHATSGIAESSLRQWIREGVLPAYKVGKHVRVFVEDWEALFKRIGA